MSKRRVAMEDRGFGLLDENLMLNILDRIHEIADRQAWCLVCRRFLQMEARSRKSVKLLRVDALEEILRRYTEVESIDLSYCLEVSDDALDVVANVAGHRLKSISLAKISQFSDVGLVRLLSKCPSLRELDLSYCSYITDNGIVGVTALKNLEVLKLENCRNITDAGLGAIAAGCKVLRHLSLRWCLGVTDMGISLLSMNCKQLETLDLSYTEVTAKGLESITELESLKNLLLMSCNSVDDACLECLKKCRASLRVLDVARCHNVSGQGIRALASGPVSLQQLTLSYCLPITNGLLATLEKFDSLQVIRLDGCHIEGNELAFIGKGCKSLKVFSVSKCSGVTDEGIQAVVEECRDLDEIDLTCCRELTDLTLTSIAKSCRGLLSLKMESCGLITHLGLSYLGSGCTRLEALDLTDCRSVDDEGLKWLSRCTALRTLKLGICLSVSDRGIAYIAASCSNLREIDLYRSTAVGDSSAAAIAHGCPRLRVLNLSYCSRITDAGLLSISQLRDLRHLEIRACQLVTSMGLLYVSAGCTRLVELDVKSCTAIDDSGLSAIAAGCRNLRQVNLSCCPITDVGLLAIASLSCMQNMKLLHLRKVTPEGIREAVFNCGNLKKVKLSTALRTQIPPEMRQISEARGCRLRWMEKPAS
ncbi:unnamed protein product [Calypogeia fissa]